MILAYSFIGLILASIGGAAPGASNIAVLATTRKHSLQKAMRIAIGAGIGEMLLALLALCYSSFFIHFFEMNSWAQILFTCIFFVVGIGFYFSHQLDFTFKSRASHSRFNSEVVTGFLLGFINPPVLLFWILGISVTQKYLLPLTDMSPNTILILFFMGVFLGKVTILYGYAKLGKGLQKHQQRSTAQTNKIIGIALLLLGSIQVIRLIF